MWIKPLPRGWFDRFHPSAWLQNDGVPAPARNPPLDCSQAPVQIAIMRPAITNPSAVQPHAANGTSPTAISNAYGLLSRKNKLPVGGVRFR